MSTNPRYGTISRDRRTSAALRDQPTANMIAAASGLGPDDTLLENKAAIEATLTRLDDAIGLLREIIESKSLDTAHGRGTALSRIDLGLNLALNRRNFVGLAHDFHPQGRRVDKRVERQYRKDGAGGARGGDVVDAKQSPEHGLASDGVGREVGVAEDEIVAVPHGP